MKRLLPWFYVISVTGFVLWIGWTSPTVKECLTNQYEDYGSDPLQEKIGDFYGFLVGSRLCIGDFIHENGEGIIAIFTVILGIATWFLWRATRNLVEDARITGTKQLEVAKISSNAAQVAAAAAKEAAQHIPVVERAWLFGGPSPEGVAPNDDVMRFKVRVYNYGKTPGIVKEVWWDAVANEPTSHDAKYVGGHPHKLDVVIPSGDEVFIHRLTVSAKPNEFLIGYIAYDDIFKQPHKSRFCLRICTGPLRFENAGHPAWNDYD